MDGNFGITLVLIGLDFYIRKLLFYAECIFLLVILIINALNLYRFKTPEVFC